MVWGCHAIGCCRSLLGIGEFSPLQVVELIQQMAATGAVQQQGVQWVQRMLLCLFGMLEATAPAAPAGPTSAAGSIEPGRGSNKSSDVTGSGSSWAVQLSQLSRLQVLQKLRRLPILLLKNGAFASIDGDQHQQQQASQAAQVAAPVFLPLQSLPGPKQLSAPVSKDMASLATSHPCGNNSAGADALGVGELLGAAGIDESWLTQLQVLSVDLFTGLSQEDLELMTSGLAVRTVRTVGAD